MLFRTSVVCKRSAPASFFALCVSLSMPGSDYVFATTATGPIDRQGDDLQDKLNEVINTPFDFCDPAKEAAHLMAIITASGSLTNRRLAKRPQRPGDLKRAEERAVQDNNADGGDFVKDLT